MKTILIITASLLFSTLFYGQHIGLNLSLFSIVTIILLFSFNRATLFNKEFLVYGAVYALTALLVFFINSKLAILANCIAFFSLVGYTANSGTSLFISWLNGLYTSIAGFFHRNFQLDEATQTTTLKKDIDIWHWIKLIGIPLALIILFILLYQNGNPIFEGLVKSINFEFLNFQWVLFCILGFYLFSNIINPVLIDSITTADLSATNDLRDKKKSSEEQLAKELQLGLVLLVFLNSLIIFYLFTDVMYLLQKELLDEVSLTQQVHNSVNALIASIVIAISVLLIVFRGDLNFYKKNKFLQYLSYLWIGLNMMLVGTIALKNNEYIVNYGLTYKRIGVYVYLLLTLIGLFTTFIKILKIQNLWFLFRTNTQAAFAILIVASFINWDQQITKYNLYKAAHLDLAYLINLSNQNAVQLKRYSTNKKLPSSQKLLIDNKYRAHISKNAILNWQELSYTNLSLRTQNYSIVK